MSLQRNAPITCPLCGAKMRLRTNKLTGDKFYGCKSFPGCRGTRTVDEGKMIAREGATGRTIAQKNVAWDADPNNQLDL